MAYFRNGVEVSSATSVSYTQVTAAYTANDNDYLLADTSGGAFDITLPAAASAGNVIHIKDAKGTFNVNNLTVARNAHNIRNVASDLILDVNWSEIVIVYVDATVGWRY